MIVSIDEKAKPCPGVEQAIERTEEKLRQNEVVFAIGGLIHNRREVERLQNLGLKIVTREELGRIDKKALVNAHFLVRTHGETEEIIEEARMLGLRILDATCPIVRHSQEIVAEHVKDGWGIIIVGKNAHPEVAGLKERTRGSGVVLSSERDISRTDFVNRSVLLAQSTIDPALFNRIRRRLINKLPDLKVMDTTCRFLSNRQKDIREFSSQNDAVIHVGGVNSSNGELLFSTGLEVNGNSYRVEAPEEVDPRWLRKIERIGVTGCASTPRWQLDEMKSYLDNTHFEKNPKGLKNRKGGQFAWWTRKKQ